MLRSRALVLVLALAAAPLTLAEEPEQEVPAAEGAGQVTPDQALPRGTAPPSGIEAIEVTGERLNEANVQDEAQAITAFTGADLDRASIVNVESLAFSVPGLHVGQSAQAPLITLRGIGTENASLTGEPGVAFHVDGLNISRPAAARVAFFDLETLDVKRGPQGLLGGKNSTSGSLNLLSRKPTDEFEVNGDVLFGNYDRVRFRGALNIPFGEYISSRIAFFQENRDGYLDNLELDDSRDPFDADDLGLRAHLKFTPLDNAELLLSYNYFRQDGNGLQSDAVALPRKVWPSWATAPGTQFGELAVAPDGRLPAGYRRACRLAPEPFTTLLPIASACYDQLYRDEAVYPGRVNVAANGTVTPVPPGAPLGLPPRRVVQDVRRTGQPGKTTRLVDPQTGRDPIQFGNYDPVNNQTNFEDFTFWNPSTEDADPRSIYTDQPSSQRNRYWGWTANLGIDVPELPLVGETRLSLVGGFQRTEIGVVQDFDSTQVAVASYTLADEADQYGADLRWSGTGFGERLEWQASLFHSHEKAGRDFDAPGLNGSDNGSVFSEQTTDNKAYGVALHGSYALTDALSVSLGGRLIKDRKDTWLLRTVPAADNLNRFRGCLGNLGIFSTPEDPLPRPGANPHCSDVYRGRMWGAGLEWRPFGDEHLLYAKLDRGYKSGGFQAGTVGKYKPERIWAYALGTKSEFLDQQVRLNLEGFFYNYQDLQLVILDGLALRTENTDARMYGWDLEAIATPLEGLNLSATLSFLKTRTIDYFSLDPSTEPPASVTNVDGFEEWHRKRLDERETAEATARDEQGRNSFALRSCFVEPGSPIQVPCGELGDQGGLDDFSGNQLSRAPEWKYTLSAEYQIPIGRFGSLTPRVQYTFHDDTYFRAYNRSFDLQEDYHLTDVKLIWTSPEQLWTVEAFVQNIEDEAPKQNILIGPRQFGGPPLAWYGPPRFYGIQLGFKY